MNTDGKQDEKIPKCPCFGCVPPKRNADCHGKCERYLAWDAVNRHISREKWQRKEDASYTSRAMMKIIRRKQMRKGPRIRRSTDF